MLMNLLCFSFREQNGCAPYLQCFIGISKHREESQKYEAQQSIFDKIRGVWIADETVSRVFDIHVSSQSKLKLRRKRRHEIKN